MSAELFSQDEGRALLDIVREYLLRVPGDLDDTKRHVLGVLMDEAQCAIETPTGPAVPEQWPRLVKPDRSE